MKGDTVSVHSQPHLNNGIVPVLLRFAELTELIRLINLEVKVRHIVVDRLGISPVLGSYLLVQVSLALIRYLGKVGKSAVHICQREVKALKVSALFLESLLLRTRRQQS
ncbi:MAG: hypothetical protein DDT35_00239 [Firmicutes bacterium]|nr:hypothetical protein [Bacillota bacterium]